MAALESIRKHIISQKQSNKVLSINLSIFKNKTDAFSIDTCILFSGLFNPRLPEPFFVTRLPKGGGVVTTPRFSL